MESIPKTDAAHARADGNSIEALKASMDGDGLRIRHELPEMIVRGAAALTPAQKELLKWLGVFCN